MKPPLSPRIRTLTVSLSLSETQASLTSHGLGWTIEGKLDGKRVNFVVGDVRKTLYLEGAVPEKIAFLHLDTDFYDSTKAELEVLWPRVSPGGVVVIDDYGHWKGCGKAVDEFFGSRLLQVEYREEPLRKLADDVRADPERFADFVGVYHKVDYTAIRIFKVK
jgi:hypothetical protein